jgi:DNA polymerase delta subunit 1
MNIVSKYAHDGGFYINTPRAKRKWGEVETDVQDKYQGAHCFEPIVGIHTDYILGLDFASLYPSVIRRYNIDPSTLVLAPTNHEQVKRLLTDTDDTFAMFVAGGKQAPIPLLLEELGKARSVVKKQMGTATDQERLILNQRQTAIKVTMNSVYGFLGMSTGPIGRQELAAAVTAYGRDLIRGTAKYILSTYPGAVIVGGDTDSVYCTLPIEKTLTASFAEGSKITVAIGEMFGTPIALEMEKVYTPMLYLKKKMYAAIMYEKPTDAGKLDVKGIALARGDSSMMTKKLQLESINIIMNNPTNARDSIKGLIAEAISTIKDQEKSILVKSKKLGSNYKHEDRQIQINVINKMKARGQSVPNVGERVYYLVGMGAGGISKRADHPDYITDIDYQYYIDSQIFKPMKGILNILNKDWKSHFLA